MSAINKPRMPELRRTSLTTAARCFIAAAVGVLVSWLLLLIHIFASAEALQLVAVWISGASLLCAWAGVLTWRMPVFANRTLVLFAIGWAVGISISIWLSLWAFADRPLIWRASMQWLALTLAFAVGALLLRALLRKRTTPTIGRLLSLVSPLIVLLVVLFTYLGRAA